MLLLVLPVVVSVTSGGAVGTQPPGPEVKGNPLEDGINLLNIYSYSLVKRIIYDQMLYVNKY